MALLAKTRTKGFRTCYFRNQPVHKFYGHLQAVLKAIDPSGSMNQMFARPESVSGADGSDTEMEWSTELEGKITSFNKLDAEQQKQVASTLSANLEKIRAYAEANQNKGGIEKDYAQYLKAVAMSPDLNQIFVINNQPVLVHWGLICESDQHPGQGMYAGWDEFVSQIQKKAKAEPATEPPSAPPTQEITRPSPEKEQKPEAEKRPDQAEAAAEVFSQPPEEKKEARKDDKKEIEKEKTNQEQPPAKEPQKKVEEKSEKEPDEEPDEEPEKEPEKETEEEPVDEEQEILACGLGRFRWVKWLAILLAIIILLLLLLRLLPPSNPMGNMPGGMQGSGMGMPGGGGAGGGGGSGMPPGMGSGGNGGNMPQMPAGSQMPVTCPQCGHKIDPKTGEHQTDETINQPGGKAPVAEKTGEPASKVASEPTSEN